MPTTVLASAGCLSGVLISPDLDMANRTVSETVVIRWLGVLGYLWMVLWKPYACLHKHRGISHVPLIGTLTRVGYLAVCYVIIHCVAREFYPTRFAHLAAAVLATRAGAIRRTHHFGRGPLGAGWFCVAVGEVAHSLGKYL